MVRIWVFVTCLAVLTASVALADGPITMFKWASSSSYSLGVDIRLCSDASMGYDSGEIYRQTYDYCGETNEVKSYFYRESGVDNWDGPNGWYSCQALPTLELGSSIVLKGLYVWAWPAFEYDSFKINYDGSSFTQFNEWVRTLRLVKVPNGINYTGPWEWTIPWRPRVDRTFPDALLPAYRTDDPLTGYVFEIEIQHVVPEPSSLSVLGGLVVSAVGFAIRRKRS